jgi:hypothetical protein
MLTKINQVKVFAEVIDTVEGFLFKPVILKNITNASMGVEEKLYFTIYDRDGKIICGGTPPTAGHIRENNEGKQKCQTSGTIVEYANKHYHNWLMIEVGYQYLTITEGKTECKTAYKGFYGKHTGLQSAEYTNLIEYSDGSTVKQTFIVNDNDMSFTAIESE